MSIEKAGKEYFPAIDGLRAVAVIAVVLFHLDLSWFQGGYVGVDVFFVISGYLITRNIVQAIDRQRFSLVNFYIARFRRLFPALIVTIAATLVLGVLLFSPDALIRLSGSAIASILSLANIRFWLTSGYFDIDHSFKPLLHFWSLSVEEQFYLVWPILIVSVFGLSRRHRDALIIIGAVFFLSLISSQIMLSVSPDTAFYWMPFRAFEFALGALFVFAERLPVDVISKYFDRSAGLTFFGLGLILFSSVTYSSSTPIPGWNVLVPVFGAALVIASRGSMLAQLILSNKLSVWLGRISYSLYLVHWPIWVYASFFVVREFSPSEKGVIFVLMLVLAAILHYGVEKRFRRPARAVRIVTASTLAFCVLGIAILLCSWLLRSQDGWPARVVDGTVEPASRLVDCEYQDGRGWQECKLRSVKNHQKSILLIGDSHSMNLRHGLAGFAKDNSYSFKSISVAGCPPLIDIEVRYSVSGKTDSRCEKFSALLEHEIGNGQYFAVVFSARWMWFYEHQSYSNDTASPAVFLSGLTKVSDSTLDSREAWSNSLNKTVGFTKQHSDKVIVLSQYPLLHKGIGECNKSPSYLIPKSDHALRCKVKIKYEEVMARLAFTNKTISNLSDANVLSIAPSDHLCSDLDRQCRVLTERGLLYADENHLSELGAEELVKSISAQLNTFLKNE